MRRITVTLLTLSVAGLALAADTWHTSTIRYVYPQAAGSVVITFDDESQACTSGSNPKYYHIRVGENGVTQEGLEVLYAAALAAHLSGRSVQINFDSSSSYCWINRLRVL
jgi:hypothetical protein